MRKPILFMTMCLVTLAGVACGAEDATSIGPPNLIYGVPEASTAVYAEGALNAQNAMNATNCTGGPAGHCYTGSGSSSGGGETLTFVPDPSRNTVIDFWQSGGPACSMGHRYTVTKTPWALYSGGMFVMMMPESAAALAEQGYIGQDHLPEPSPWTDHRTTTFSYTGTPYRVPPPLGRLCP